MKSTTKKYHDTRSVYFQCNVYDVECYVYPGEPETRDYPGSGDEIEIISISSNDEEVMDSLTIGELRQIEDLALGL